MKLPDRGFTPNTGRRVAALGIAIASAACVAFALGTLIGAGGAAASTGKRVLRVGTYHGVPGQYGTIQAAVDAARRGDWILIAPGDYKTTSSRAPKGASSTPAGILITTPRLHLRGMNRNTVVVDGTKPGSPKCSRRAVDQNFGPKPGHAKKPVGLNGIMVFKADHVSVENLTACNFLNGSGGNAGNGNQIWWNGGANSGKIGGWGFYGSYLTGTSTYYRKEATAAAYGIFSSNWSGGSCAAQIPPLHGQEGRGELECGLPGRGRVRLPDLLRRRDRAMPAERPLPAPQEGRDAPPSEGPKDHAGPVRGSAQKPVV